MVKKLVWIISITLMINCVSLAGDVYLDQGPYLFDDSTYQNDSVYLADYAYGEIVSGGNINYFAATENSSLVMTNGFVNTDLQAAGYSNVNISGGTINSNIHSYDHSNVDVTGAVIRDDIRSYASSNVNFKGGAVGDIMAYNDSTVNITGGYVYQSLVAYDSSTIFLHGINFMVNGYELSYGDKLSDFASYMYHSISNQLFDNQ